jgi:hypothetical protein
LCEPATQCLGRHEVDERLPAVDLHDREQLAVTGLQLRVAVDQDLVEVEAELVPQRDDRLASALAEMAARRAVQRDEGYG